MKRLNQVFAAALVAVVFFIGTAAQNIKEADFNGIWHLDTVKTDFGGVPKAEAAAIVMSLTQTADSVRFERVFTSLPEPSRQTLSLDGRPLETKKENTSSVRTLTISSDKKVLTVLTKARLTKPGSDPVEYTRTETYTLSSDGETLLLTRIAVLPNVTETVKAVYNKE